MVCLRNICINTLHKGGKDNNNNNNNNNNNKFIIIIINIVKGICIRNLKKLNQLSCLFRRQTDCNRANDKLIYTDEVTQPDMLAYQHSHITQTDCLKWSASYICLYQRRVNQLALNHHITGRFTSGTRQLYTHSKWYGTVISHNKSQITYTRVMH